MREVAPIKFNVNGTVRVKLTDFGRAVHAEGHAAFWGDFHPPMKYTPPKADQDGWSEWQLWGLMADFGQHLGIGRKLPFETEIELVAPRSAAPTQAHDYNELLSVVGDIVSEGHMNQEALARLRAHLESKPRT